MICVHTLWLIGAVVAVLAFSARSAYEELDQDQPYILWPTLAVQWVGYAMLGLALVRNGASPWLVAPAVALLAVHSLLEALYVLPSEVFTQLFLFAAVAGLAAAIIIASRNSNATSGSLPLTVAGAVTILLAHTVFVPAEEDRRLASGPGMALLMLGWLLLGMGQCGSSVALAGSASVSADAWGYFTPDSGSGSAGTNLLTSAPPGGSGSGSANAFADLSPSDFFTPTSSPTSAPPGGSYPLFDRH
jgi:hypothetical protein